MRQQLRVSRCRGVWPALASVAEASRSVHFDAAPSVALRTLLVGASWRHLHVAPCEGFAAHALLGARLRRRSAIPLAARLLHSAPPDRTSSQHQEHGKGDGADVPLRELHSSALAASRDDPAAPPREVREVTTRTCVRGGACGALVSVSLTQLACLPSAVGCRVQVDIGDLTEARAEVARAVKSAQGEDAGRVQEATQMTKTVATWIASVPAKLGGLARMSRAEWQTMLNGFWVAIKKEAHHFWVSRTRPAASSCAEPLFCRSPGRQQAALRRGSDFHAPHWRRAARESAVTVRAASARLLVVLAPFDTRVSGASASS